MTTNDVNVVVWEIYSVVLVVLRLVNYNSVTITQPTILSNLACNEEQMTQGLVVAFLVLRQEVILFRYHHKMDCSDRVLIFNGYAFIIFKKNFGAITIARDNKVKN